MQTSITLAQLPYTGFDYGDMYNTLFWVALLAWSFMLAWVVRRKRIVIGRLFTKLSKVFIVQRRTPQVSAPSTPQPAPQAQATMPEPQILTERVVRFDPLVDPIAAKSMRQKETLPHVAVVQEPMVPHDSLAVVARRDETSQDRVRQLVENELAVSRLGQTPDEFSSSDFAIVDFDGVNPDDSWQPRAEKPIMKIPPVKPLRKEQEEVVQVQWTALQEEAQMQKPIVEKKIEKTPDKLIYRDSIALSTEAEYPKLVLTRAQQSLS